MDITVPNIPNNEEAGEHTVPFDRVLYIDRDDFREVSVTNGRHTHRRVF